jgi:GT2 family glycosyltransferase
VDPSVCIIVLNWNNYRDTLECLESLYQVDYSNYCVIVVDNASTNDSIQELLLYARGNITIKSKFFECGSGVRPKNVMTCMREEITKENNGRHFMPASPLDRKMILLKNEKNYGFAEGNNIAIRFAMNIFEPQYILLLNNDVVVDKAFLAELVEVAERERKIGIVGPRIYYYDFFGRSDVIDFAGEDIVLWKGRGVRHKSVEIHGGRHDRAEVVDKINGACMLVKKEVIEKVGLLDPAFFMYWEETDFCFRAKRKGYKSVYVSTSKIWHKGASSKSGIYDFGRDKIYFMTRNRFLFVKRNADRFDTVRFLVYFFCWDVWLVIGQIIKHRKFKVLVPYIEGLLAGLALFMRNKSGKEA